MGGSSAFRHDLDDLEPVDLLIIGSGATAQSVARRASLGGLRTLVLEAGSGSARSSVLQHQVGPHVPLNGTHAPDPSGQTSIRLGGSLDLPAIRLTPSGTEHAGIRLARPRDVDVTERHTLGLAAWPVGLDQLDRYFDEALQLFGIGPSEISIEPRPLGNCSIVPFWCADRRVFSHPDTSHFGLADVRLGAPVWRLEIDAHGNVRAAHVRHAAGSVLVPAERFVLAAGIYESTRILLASQWPDGAPAANSSGLLGRGLMDHPQLALGRVRPKHESGGSMLAGLAPAELGSGAVSWPMVVAEPAPMSVGLAAIALPSSGRHRDEPHRILGGLHSTQALADQVRARRIDRRTAGHVVRSLVGARDVIDLERDKRERVATHWSFENGWWRSVVDTATAVFDLIAIAEQLPDDRNRVELSRQISPMGWERPRITWNWSPDDRRRADAAADRIFDALADQVDVIERVEQRRHVLKFSSHHGSGTMRMSARPQDGVVDGNCQVHDHPNLFVVGSAVFPSASCFNPTLTDVALGLRLADHLLGRRDSVFARGS